MIFNIPLILKFSNSMSIFYLFHNDCYPEKVPSHACLNTCFCCTYSHKHYSIQTTFRFHVSKKPQTCLTIFSRFPQKQRVWDFRIVQCSKSIKEVRLEPTISEFQTTVGTISHQSHSYLTDSSSKAKYLKEYKK